MAPAPSTSSGQALIFLSEHKASYLVSTVCENTKVIGSLVPV